MIKEGKFGVQETVCLAAITISTKLFYTSPGFLTRFVGNAGWYMTLISNTTAIAAFSLIYLLLKRFPGKSIVEIFELVWGRVVGILLTFIYTVALLNAAGVVVREFSDVAKIFALPASPLSLIMGGLMLVILVAVFLGLESIARLAKLVGYIMIFMYGLLILLAIPYYNLGNLFPFWGYGLGRTIIVGLKRSSAYTEVVILAVFASSLQGSNHIKRAGYLSLIIAGLTISSGLLSLSLAFPYSTLQELNSPMYILTRQIRFSGFFQRLDPIFFLLWTAATFVTTSALFYAAISTFCKMFRLQDPRPVIIPLLVILFSFAMVPSGFAGVVEGGVQIAREYSWTIFFGIPIITLLVAIIRRRKGEVKSA
ncbi:MAG TPA: endospore germination permease [Bacillota bacterium]|nr:endospore germination permease [Bacillota bacterium]